MATDLLEDLDELPAPEQLPPEREPTLDERSHPMRKLLCYVEQIKRCDQFLGGTGAPDEKLGVLNRMQALSERIAEVARCMGNELDKSIGACAPVSAVSDPAVIRFALAKGYSPYHDVDEALGELPEVLDMGLSGLGISVRSVNALEEKGVFTVGQLLRWTREELEGIPNFGAKSVEQVYRALERVGLRRRAVKPR